MLTKTVEGGEPELVVSEALNVVVVVVRLFIGTQNRLVALHSALILGSRRGEQQPAQCNLSTH
jgi:hypothetical protein